jgi:hypothetical protein
VIPKVIIDRSPAQIVSTFQMTVTKAVAEAQKNREGGNPDWWRPLEASLAVIGSQSEDVLVCIEDELDSGREKPINIDYLLVEVIPSFLSLDGKPDATNLVLALLPGHIRVPIFARTRLCLRKSILSSVTPRNCRKLSRCSNPSH